MRCFVAIELPLQVKTELARIQQQYRKAGMGFLRWVSPNSIHLTLKFLGELPEESVAGIMKAIDEAVRGVAPFELELNGLGVFPLTRAPRVFWAGIGGDVDSLKNLQANVDVALGLLGYEEESREFTAHLTLARVRDDATPQERQALGELVAASRLASRAYFTAVETCLMRSELKPTGPVYTRLAATPLVGR